MNALNHLINLNKIKLKRELSHFVSFLIALELFSIFTLISTVNHF